MVPSPVGAAAGESRHSSTGTGVSCEVADVVRAYGAKFVRRHRTSAAQRRVLNAIVSCRTARLGGHVERCEGCGHQRIAYNSCRNRHCPKCLGAQSARWMAAERAMLLAVPYFHVVFTLPHALTALVRCNRRRLYSLLFDAAAATLRTFALDPRHLGAEPAITMVLHTWGQTLTEHFHVHCVVSGGGLALDGSAWVPLPNARNKHRRPFLFPVRALSIVFRAKYLAALRCARRRGMLRFSGQSATLADFVPWEQLLDSLARRDWVVYCKPVLSPAEGPPFGGPEQVLKYLSRYTHRVANSNRRITFVGDGLVRFTWKDYADHSNRKEMTLPAEEFLRRFLLHIVPRGFMRIRHYGVSANRHRRRKLARCRELLGAASTPAPAQVSTDLEAEVTTDAEATNATEVARTPCPHCGGRMRTVEILLPTIRDTS